MKEKKQKTMIESLLEKGGEISDGEAIIILDEIRRKEGMTEVEEVLNGRLAHIKKRIINGSFNINNCKNINTNLASHIIALTQKSALLTTLNVNNTVSQPEKKRI